MNEICIWRKRGTVFVRPDGSWSPKVAQGRPRSPWASQVPLECLQSGRISRNSAECHEFWKIRGILRNSVKSCGISRTAEEFHRFPQLFFPKTEAFIFWRIAECEAAPKWLHGRRASFWLDEHHQNDVDFLQMDSTGPPSTSRWVKLKNPKNSKANNSQNGIPYNGKSQWARW